MAFTERYVTTSATGFGGGTSESDSWSIDQAYAGQSAGTRINVQSGTYNIASTLQANISGTATSPIVWRGYKTTPGDLDGKPTSTAVPGTDCPLLSVTGGSVYLKNDGDHQRLENMAYEADDTYPAYVATKYSMWRNCQWSYTGTGSAAAMSGLYSSFCTFIGCSFRVTNASGTGNALETGHNTFIGCFFERAAQNQQIIYATGNLTLLNCILDTGSKALYTNGSGTTITLAGNTIYNISGDGFALRDGQTMTVLNNLFHTVGDCVTGLASSYSGLLPIVMNNSYYNISGSQMGTPIHADTGQQFAITESSDPLEDPSNNDFSLKDGASSIGAAYPYQFIAADQRQYKDVGAGQRDGGSGGGGGFRRLTFNGGMTG